MYDVELIGLKKSFRDVVAVDDVSLNIEKGEFLFLLGPSGCGKTTTLRMIGGLEDPTEGIVRIQGRDVSNLPPEKRDTATVFQSWALFPHKSIRENVGFGLKMRKVPKSKVRDKVEEYLSMVGLSGYGNRYPQQLSGGQKQRVALARALIVEPAVLLLDEPLSALDLKLRQQMRFEIKRIQRALDVTTVFVTHDQTEALAMADRVAIMKEGRIEQIGSPSDVYFHPKTRFVSDFIGEMNFIDARIEKRNSHTVTLRLPDSRIIEMPSSGTAGLQDRVVLGIRPEKLFVTETPKADDRRLLLTGSLIDTTFMGQLLRFHVAFGGGTLMVDDFGGINQALRYRPGEAIHMAVDPEDCLLMPAEDK